MTTRTEISSNDSVIDSRSVIERIDDLEGTLQAVYDQFVDDYEGPGGAPPTSKTGSPRPATVEPTSTRTTPSS
jgi:hypothetical protein